MEGQEREVMSGRSTRGALWNRRYRTERSGAAQHRHGLLQRSLCEATKAASHEVQGRPYMSHGQSFVCRGFAF